MSCCAPESSLDHCAVALAAAALPSDATRAEIAKLANRIVADHRRQRSALGELRADDIAPMLEELG